MARQSNEEGDLANNFFSDVNKNMHIINNNDFNNTIKMMVVILTEALLTLITMILINVITIIMIVWTKKETDHSGNIVMIILSK